MIKTAIFVEGQTELVFVREYLLKRFDYQNISLECYTLFTDSDFRSTEYRFPNEGATHYFQIMNVGNDNAVLSRLLRREQYLWNVGFQQIIGLRDMYSKQYRETVKNTTIDPKLNQSFIEGNQATIDKMARIPNKIHFHYAIMEVETWMLGLYWSFQGMDTRLTPAFIKQKLGFDLEAIDPEIIFFHPAKQIEAIYQLVDEKYNKSKGNIEAIMSQLQKVDFELLEMSGKCESFKTFSKSLIINGL